MGGSRLHIRCESVLAHFSMGILETAPGCPFKISRIDGGGGGVEVVVNAVLLATTGGQACSSVLFERTTRTRIAAQNTTSRRYRKRILLCGDIQGVLFC